MTKDLTVKFLEENGKQDVYKATVVSFNGDKLHLHGKLKENMIELMLIKVKPVSNHRVYLHW